MGGRGLLDAAGLNRPNHMHGQSLLPMLRGDAAGPDAAFIETDDGSIGIRTTHHLYGLRSENDALTTQPHHFYNLTEDPFQHSGPPHANHARQIDGMDERLRAWNIHTPWAALRLQR